MCQRIVASSPAGDGARWRSWQEEIFAADDRHARLLQDFVGESIIGASVAAVALFCGIPCAPTGGRNAAIYRREATLKSSPERRRDREIQPESAQANAA